MFYGIEQSTDLRDPRTVVKKFASEAKIKQWLSGGGGYTHDDPDGARNHHRTFRYGYVLIGRIDLKDPVFKDTGSRDYPRWRADNLATYIKKFGSELPL